MRSILADIQFSCRLLRREPIFSLVVVATLALGIGANSAIFAVVHAVLLRPLPYREPAKIVVIQEAIAHLAPQGVDLPAPDVVDFQKQSTAFESVAGFFATEMDLTGSGTPERIHTLRASAELFDVLGVQPMLGRPFNRDEDRTGIRVCVLSYGFWQRRFGGDPTVLGKLVHLDRQPYKVLGVMPKSFEFPLSGISYGGTRVDAWVPMSFSKVELGRIGDNFNYAVVARLKDGVTLAQAVSYATAVTARIQQKYPPKLRDQFQLSAKVSFAADHILSESRGLMILLAGAVGFVLLIACTNVANLLLSRAARRRRELAIRASVGASRARLIRQLLTESVVLAIAGGIAGIGLAALLMETLVRALPADIPRVGQANLDGTVLAVTLLLAVAAGILLGMIPALSGSSVGDMKQTQRGSGARSRLRGSLVVAETALSLALLIGAGLLIRSLIALRAVNPGFTTTHVLRAGVALPASFYRDKSSIRDFFQRLFDNISAIPGVKAKGGASAPLLSIEWNRLFTTRDSGSASGRSLSAHAVVYGDYFQTMEIPLLEGRFFDTQDRPGSEGVVIVNETLARRYFPGRSAVGRQVKWGPPQSDSPWVTIVGVVGDTHAGGLASEPPAQTYEPFGMVPLSSLNVVVRATGDPAALATALRGAVAAVDPEIPVRNLETVGSIFNRAVAPARSEAWLLASFAALALLLAAIGLYGVVSYAVTQRAPEIGIRMALGATPQSVLKLVLGSGLALVSLGLGIGLTASFALVRLLAGFLYGVQPTDAITFAVAPAVLCVVAIAANLIPARRAAKVDPLVALRSE